MLIIDFFAWPLQRPSIDPLVVVVLVSCFSEKLVFEQMVCQKDNLWLLHFACFSLCLSLSHFDKDKRRPTADTPVGSK